MPRLENKSMDIDDRVKRTLAFPIQVVDLELGMVKREQRKGEYFGPLVQALNGKALATLGEDLPDKTELVQFRLQDKVLYKVHLEEVARLCVSTSLVSRVYV